jgi:uncharacterized membrane protein
MSNTQYFMSTVVPCIAAFTFFALVFGFIMIWRWFRHREIMAQIQHGLVLGDQQAEIANASASQKLLGRGLALAALGLALLIGLYPFGFVVSEPWPLHFGPWMLLGLIPLFIGLALLVTYYVSARNHGTQEAEEMRKEETYTENERA